MVTRAWPYPWGKESCPLNAPDAQRVAPLFQTRTGGMVLGSFANSAASSRHRGEESGDPRSVGCEAKGASGGLAELRSHRIPPHLGRLPLRHPEMFFCAAERLGRSWRNRQTGFQEVGISRRPFVLSSDERAQIGDFQKNCTPGEARFPDQRQREMTRCLLERTWRLFRKPRQPCSKRRCTLLMRAQRQQ